MWFVYSFRDSVHYSHCGEHSVLESDMGDIPRLSDSKKRVWIQSGFPTYQRLPLVHTNASKVKPNSKRPHLLQKGYMFESSQVVPLCMSYKGHFHENYQIFCMFYSTFMVHIIQFVSMLFVCLIDLFVGW